MNHGAHRKGAAAAWALYGYTKTADEQEEPGFLRRHAPALTASALAALSAPLLYKHLRQRRLSADPALRAIQDAAKGQYTRVLPGAENKVSPAKKWLDRMLYAGGGDIKYKEDLKRLAREKGKMPEVAGAVMHDLPGEQLAKGHTDLISNPVSNSVGSEFGDGNKWREYQIFNQFAPGAMGRSENVADVLHGLGYNLSHKNPTEQAKLVAKFRKTMSENGAARHEMAQKLDTRMREQYGKGFLLKDVDASATGGKFPSEKHNLAALLHGESPEAKTMANVVRDPRQVMVQEKLPLEQGTWLDRQYAKLRGNPASKEVRVHVMNGAVAPDLTVGRFSPSMHILDRNKLTGAEAFTRDLLGKLPPELRHGTYAMDIAPVVGGGYKLIESNPGYRSGFLNPQNYPITGPLAHRQFTGQWSKPVAKGLAGLGAAGIGAAGYAATNSAAPTESEPPPTPRVNRLDPVA